jgi:hypothetical protein
MKLNFENIPNLSNLNLDVDKIDRNLTKFATFNEDHPNMAKFFKPGQEEENQLSSTGNILKSQQFSLGESHSQKSGALDSSTVIYNQEIGNKPLTELEMQLKSIEIQKRLGVNLQPPSHLNLEKSTNFDKSALGHAESFLEKLKDQDEAQIDMDKLKVGAQDQPNYFNVSGLDVSSIRKDYEAKMEKEQDEINQIGGNLTKLDLS